MRVYHNGGVPKTILGNQTEGGYITAKAIECSDWNTKGQWGQICPFDKSSSGPKELRIDGFVPWHRVVSLTRFPLFGSSGD